MSKFKQYLKEAEEAAGNYPTDTNPLVDATKPFALNNPKIIFIGDDKGTGEYAPVGKNPVASSRFRQWDNEQMHARNKGYMLKYVGNDPELAKQAEWEGEAPRTGYNMAGEKLPPVGQQEPAQPAPQPAAQPAQPQQQQQQQMQEANLEDILRLAGISR